jgi:phosphocarrier protein
MQTRDVTVGHPNGLHSRICARLAQTAMRLGCEASLLAGGRRASARSVIALMLLAASVGSTVRIEVDGPEEAQAMRELADLIAGTSSPP